MSEHVYYKIWGNLVSYDIHGSVFVWTGARENSQENCTSVHELHDQNRRREYYDERQLNMDTWRRDGICFAQRVTSSYVDCVIAQLSNDTYSKPSHRHPTSAVVFWGLYEM